MFTEAKEALRTSECREETLGERWKGSSCKELKGVFANPIGITKRNLLNSSHVNNVYAGLHSALLLRGAIRSFFPEGLRGSSGKNLNQPTKEEENEY